MNEEKLNIEHTAETEINRLKHAIAIAEHILFGDSEGGCLKPLSARACRRLGEFLEDIRIVKMPVADACKIYNEKT